MTMSKWSKLMVALLCACLTGACAKLGDEAAPAATEAAVDADGTRAKGDEGQLAGSPKVGSRKNAVAGRKLIQSAQLHVEVEDYAKTRKRLDTLLSSYGGFVADARIDHADGEVSQATLTLRVPSDKLGVFLNEASGEGKVLKEELSAKDITDAYVDTNARLKNARHLESRLQELLATKTSGVKDLLEVERELARVRGEVERYEAQIRSWDERVSMSTIALQLETRRVYAAAPPPTFGVRIKTTLAGSSEALASFGRTSLLVAVALVPWMLPMALIGFGLRSVHRRLSRRRTAGSVASAS